MRVISGRLYVVYAHSVYSSQGGQSLAQASKKFKNDEVLIDTNGHFVLLKKGDKYCIDVFGRPDKKEKPREDARKCLSSDKLTYYYPSETGFWFISGKTDNLIHLSDTIAEHVIASKKFKPVHYRGITNNFAAMEAFTTDIFFLEGKSLKRGDTIDKSCVADSNVLFSSEANSDYWGLTCYRSGKEEGDIDFVSHEIFKGRSKKAVTANTIKVHGGITNIWVCNSIGKNHPMIISYTNGEYIQYNEGGKKQWARIPDLEDSVDVLAADFPSETVSQEIPQYDSYGKNFIGAFIYRVVTDCQNLVNFATSLLPRLAGFNFQELVNKVLGKESSKIENLNYYNKHGLRKNLIFVTKSNKLVSVSSMDGKTLWTLTLKPGQAIVRAMINSQNNIDLIYEEEGKKKRTEISSLEGKFISQDLPVDPKAKVFLEGASDLPPIEIGFSDHYLKNSNQNMVFYRIEKDKGVFGYRWTSDGRFEEIWNVLFEPSQTILDYSYHMKGNNEYVTKSTYGFLSALPEGEDMLFKVVDSGNIALLIKQTINGKESMEIIILNTARGKILGRFSNPAVDFSHPIAFIFDDNGVYASYMNSRLATYELWSIELMMTRIESSFIEMIQTYVLKAKKRDPIDYNADKPQFVILDRKYGLPVGLKYLGAVNTRQGLTKRNLIGITTTNDVLLCHFR